MHPATHLPPISLALALAALPFAAGSQTPPTPAPPPPTPATPFCHVLTSSSEIPPSFGAAYNLFSAEQETLVTIACGSSNTTLTVGNGQTDIYVHRIGYQWLANSWEPITLNGPNRTGDWYIGTASATLANPTVDFDEDNPVLTWYCQWIDSKWKCGCADTECVSQHWQLQAFRLNANNDDPNPCSVAKLILAPQPQLWTRTPYIVQYAEHLDSLPFDGINIATNTALARFARHNFDPNKGRSNAVPVSFDEIIDEISPLRGKLPSKEKFMLVFLGKPPDVFDEWTGYITTFSNFARATREMGWTGIAWDAEQYQPTSWLEGTDKQCNLTPNAATCSRMWDGHYWKYDFEPHRANNPKVKYADKSEAQYIAQARLRGRQLMKALIDVFPNMTLYTYGGIVSALPRNVPPRELYAPWADKSIWGGLLSGMLLEVSGTDAEIHTTDARYYLRTEEQFDNDRHFRKREFVDMDQSQSAGRQILLSTQTDKFRDDHHIAQGLYNRDICNLGGTNVPECDGRGFRPMSPATMRDVAEYALTYADEYVYFYSEFGSRENDWITPPSAGACSGGTGCYRAWLDPLQQAREAAANASCG